MQILCKQLSVPQVQVLFFEIFWNFLPEVVLICSWLNLVHMGTTYWGEPRTHCIPTSDLSTAVRRYMLKVREVASIQGNISIFPSLSLFTRIKNFFQPCFIFHFKY